MSTLAYAAKTGGEILRAYRAKGAKEVPSVAAGFMQDASMLFPALHDTFERVRREAGEEGLASLGLEIHRYARWASAGYNVFDLTPSLATGLLLTEPRPLVGAHEVADLSWPFVTFAIRIPENCIPLFYETAEEPAWARIIWCHLFHWENASKETEISVICTAMTEMDDARPLTIWFRSPLNDLIEDFSDIGGAPTREGDPPMIAEDEISRRATWRLVRNFSEWRRSQLESDDGDRPTRTDKGRPSRAAREAGGAWPVFWTAGRSVKLPADVRESVLDVLLGRSARFARSGWQLRTQHLVRGHWRQQVHGEGGMARKTIWIQPYFRGPEGAEAWSHLAMTRRRRASAASERS